MNSHNSKLLKQTIVCVLFTLALTIFIVQVHANEIKQTPPLAIQPIIPLLTDLDENPDILSKEFGSINPEEILPYLSEPQQSRSVNAVIPTNTSALEPFAPTGHFESTYIPDYYGLEVGLGDTLFLHDPHYPSEIVRSVNEGLTWFSLSTQAGMQHANSVKVSPSNKHHVLLGDNQGIHISYDAGYTWKAWATATGILQVAYSPTYVVDNQIFAISSNKLFRSNNDGQTWQETAVPTIPKQFALSPNFKTSKTIVIAAGTSGILFSDNNGTSWQSRNTGLDLNAGNGIYEIIFSPSYANDNTIFARTEYGIYRSVNKGISWGRFLPYTILDFELHPQYGANHIFFMIATVEDNGILFDVLFRSQNNGQSFKAELGYARDFELSPNYLNNHTMYAQLNDGLVQSRDDGQTWYLKSSIAPQSSIEDLLVSPSFATDRTIFMIRRGYTYEDYYSSLWKSTTFGYTWDEISLPQNNISSPIRIALSSNYKNDQTIILLISGETGKLYKSINGGQSWALLNGNLPIKGHPLYSVGLKLSPNYAQDKTIFISGYLEGLFRSTNDGQQWQQLYTDAAITSIALAPKYPSDPRLFVSLYNNGIARSNDGGTTWGSPNNFGNTSLKMSLSPNFMQDHTIFAVESGSSGGGTWKSTDAGNNWTNVSNHPTYFQGASAISSNFTNDQTFATHVANRGIYLTENAGETWYKLEGALPGDNPANIALPYWGGRILPMVGMNGNFYLYIWPTQVSAGFSCQNLILNSPDPQYASIGIGVNTSYPAQWHINADHISWLSVPEPDGFTPASSPVLIDSSQITQPVHETVNIDVHLSYRQSVSVEADVFLPCYGQSLPLIIKN